MGTKFESAPSPTKHYLPILQYSCQYSLLKAQVQIVGPCWPLPVSILEPHAYWWPVMQRPLYVHRPPAELV